MESKIHLPYAKVEQLCSKYFFSRLNLVYYDNSFLLATVATVGHLMIEGQLQYY